MGKTEKTQGPSVLAVFHADCKATRGPGSTLAVVQGGSGKCRLYGKDALAKAFPEVAPVCRTLTTPDRMAEHFEVALVVGKVACDRFMADGKLAFDGVEKVIADVGKGHKKRKGGARVVDYVTFVLCLFLTGCTLTGEGVGWQGPDGGYFACYDETACSGF